MPTWFGFRLDRGRVMFALAYAAVIAIVLFARPGVPPPTGVDVVAATSAGMALDVRAAGAAAR